MAPPLAPRQVPKLLLVSLLPIAAWFVVRPMLDPVPPLPALQASVGLSIIAFAASILLVPALGPVFKDAGRSGRDLLKTDPTPVPESLGLVCASIYIILLIIFIPFPFSATFFNRQAQQGQTKHGLVVDDFPHHQLSVYLSSLLSILMATMLGFLDDVFDIRWRHKLPIPIIASIPLLMVYFAERGNTHVVVPIPFRPILGALVNLGPLYYIYMSLLSTFATNSINILAGINGSEVSQALIIAASVALNDLFYLPWPREYKVSLPAHVFSNSTTELELGGTWAAGMAYGSEELVQRHLFSLYFMLPLIGVCAGFMYHNWYPARAFPGDTLCYVTGMAFAVVGIQAHFSKTLLLFFIPQIFNFLLSCPQLFGLVPCPRHRVPRFDSQTNLLYPSKALFPKPPKPLSVLVLRVFATLGLTELTIHPTTGVILEATNLTILNFFLLRIGPLSEKRLVQVLMASQVTGSLLAFVVRYGLAGLVYDGDRR